MTFETAFQCKAPCKNSALSLSTAALVAAGLIASASPAAAQSSTTPSSKPINLRLMEWDLPAQMDNVPGAMTVDLQGDRNRLWFVTRDQQGDAPRVYRLDLRGDKKSRNSADWYSWELDPNLSGRANGLRKIRGSKDGRYVFVHTTNSLQRVDIQSCTPITSPLSVAGFKVTADCPRATWPHDQLAAQQDPTHPANPNTGSDVSLDDYNNVFSTVAVFDSATGPGTSFVQRLNPNTDVVTRWYVGGSAGLCNLAAESAPCLSGIEVDRTGKVYFSQPEGGTGTGAIAELDTKTNTMRVWPLSKLDPGVTEPRHLRIDDDGKIWAVTGGFGNAHIVSLDPKTNRMTRHLVPDISTDLFAVAPDSGIIGYTNSDTTENVVGLLKPNRTYVTVYPDTIRYVPYKSFTATADRSTRANRTNGQTSPTAKTATGARKVTADGTFVEVNLHTGMASGPTYSSATPSLLPLGLTPDRQSSTGTFFYAVGNPGDTVFNRVGRVRLRNEVRGRIERDDDDHDDDGKRCHEDDDCDDDGIGNPMDGDNDNDGKPDVSDDDDDDDGIEDDFDTKDKKESRQSNQEDVSSGQYSQDTFAVNAGTLLVVASAASTNLLAPVSVEILNDAGQIVGSSLATPGSSVVTFIPPSTGGTYTLRTRNQSTGIATISTKILTRELWAVLPTGGE